MAPKDFHIVSIFQQCHRKLKIASESTEPFKPSLKTAIEISTKNSCRAQPSTNSARPQEQLKGLD
jgi:hypothetical protein